MREFLFESLLTVARACQRADTAIARRLPGGFVEAYMITSPLGWTRYGIQRFAWAALS